MNNILPPDSEKNLDESFDELKVDYCTTPKLKAINLIELLQCDCKPKEFILNPIIATQSISMIHAYRGIGKTFVSLNIAHAVVCGGIFLGWSVMKPRGVLFIDGEMPLHALQERMAHIVNAAEKEAVAPLIFLTPDLQDLSMPDLSTQQGQEQVEACITQEIELIIVDNLSCLVRTGRENEAESWIPLQEWALRLRAKGKSLLFIHHSSKSGTQRGTSKREDVLDTVICLKKPFDYKPEQGANFEVHFEKARYLYGQEVAPFEAQLSIDASGKQCWTTKSLELSTYDKVVALANNGIRQKEIADQLGIHKSTVSRHIGQAKETGKIAPKFFGDNYD